MYFDEECWLNPDYEPDYAHSFDPWAMYRDNVEDNDDYEEEEEEEADKTMEQVFELRFWNNAGECIKVGGKYSHSFDSFEDAMSSAEAFLIAACKNGAVELDVNNKFYEIIMD